MLDIGVGTGRTTNYFAPLTMEYVGIDISENMIKFCNNKFEENEKWRFEVADAKNLESFTDNSFDFVLFSFNGLDCITSGIKDRNKALREIRRVTKKRGFFCFSAHNLNYIWRYCQIGSLNIREIRRILLLRLNNSKSWKDLRKQNGNRTHKVMKVVGHDMIVPLLILTPKTQIAILSELGYKKIQVFDIEGKHLELSSIYENDIDYSFYYLCQA
jgi:ubiquinone/menaquinone biosynthesis C-methylase UbiE